MTGSYYQTVMNPNAIQQGLATRPGPINHNVMFANILAHEVFWLTVMGNFDDPSAPAGTLGSNTAATAGLMVISDEDAEDLADEMDAMYTNPDY